MRWIRIALRSLGQFLLIAWATLAIYYSNLPWRPARLTLAIVFTAFGIWALWLTRTPQPRRRRHRFAFAAVFVIVLAWFISIRPSHDRNWRPEAAVMPRATVDGDRARITGFRNFDYRSNDDFSPRYETRDFSLAHVSSVDLLVSYWGSRAFAHTFLSFNFNDGTPPLCISIEIRPEAGEKFAALPALFKQFELIYVVGDERDLIGVRACHRDEQVYLYPIRTTPEAARNLLLVYLDRINALADEPQFYHGLKNNCSSNIVRYANAAGRRGGFDPRHLFNGLVDRYLYDAGWVDTSIPFDQLRRRANITAAARANINAADFSQRIRAAAE